MKNTTSTIKRINHTFNIKLEVGIIYSLLVVILSNALLILGVDPMSIIILFIVLAGIGLSIPVINVLRKLTNVKKLVNRRNQFTRNGITYFN